MQFVSSNKIATSKMCVIMGSFLAITKFESVEGVQVQADIIEGILLLGKCAVVGLEVAKARSLIQPRSLVVGCSLVYVTPLLCPLVSTLESPPISKPGAHPQS